jgi:sugar lactone lactonase YvrE
MNKSILAIMFNGQWEDQLNRDQQGNIFLDFNPILFQHLLEQLRFIENKETIQFYPPPSSSLLVIPFEKMLRKLRLMQSQTFKDVRQLNVGGEILTTGQKIFNQISNLTTDLFIDSDPKVFRRLINQLREEREIDVEPVTTEENELSTSTFIPTTINYDDGICARAIWNTNGTTVAGGNGQGSGLNQLDHPMGLFIDDNASIYIADTYNHRIIKWLSGASHGEIIINSNQSKNYVSKVIVHRNGTIYYCDRFHNRIQQWFNYTEQTILSNISCWGLTLDNEGSLYISGHDDHRILKWPSQQIVAGGNGEGNDNDQLSSPYQIFLDRNQTIYIADYFNHRIMKWFNDLQEGLVVAGGNGYGDQIDQLKLPHSVIVDQMGTMYIVDFGNDRIMRWFKYSTKGTIIIGNDGSGNRTSQLSDPYDIAFDRQGNLYVADTSNHRIQMYQIDKSACATSE